MAKILIIDDDPDIVESMRVVLESNGYSVSSASCGEEGLKLTRKEEPNLVILDVMLPDGMDGFEVARRIKGDSRTNKTPILMLTAIKEKTGLDFRNEMGDGGRIPADDYCAKPLDHEALLRKIKKFVGPA